MKKYLQKIIQGIKKWYWRFRQDIHNRTVIRKWQKAGLPWPPPAEFRQQLIREYKTRYGFDTLIETGTLLGDTPWAVKDDFERIYTIELNIDRYLNAKERFYPFEHIEVIKGESSEQLKMLMEKITSPALFWLDTHDKLEKELTEMSLKREIRAILRSGQNHVILIPEARLLTGESIYPSLIEIRNVISELRPEYHFEVENDIIRSYP